MRCSVIECDADAVFRVDPEGEEYSDVYYCVVHMNSDAFNSRDGHARRWVVEFIGHFSDCAAHNGPALPVGPCNCGGSK